MEIGYLQEVKAIIKSLVLSCPNNITVDALNRDYRSTEGILIPFKKLGFQTLESFLRSIPDTIHVYGSGSTACVSAVRSGKSDHIHQMVCEQKKTRARARGKRSRARISQYDYNNSVRVPPAGQKGQTYSKRYTSDNLPTSNIQFNHTMTRSTPRNTVIKCQPLELSASFTAKKIAKDSMTNANGTHRKLFTSPQPTNQTEQTRIIKTEQSKTSLYQTNEKERKQHPQDEISQNSIQSTFDPVHNVEKLLEKCTLRDDEHISERSKSSKIEIEKNSWPAIKFPQKITSRISNNNTVTESSAVTTRKVFELNNSLEEKKRLDDMEEAVPAYAADNLVFRMDFPENTMTFGRKIPNYKIPDNVRRGSIIGIFISEIHSPYKFWFHIYKEHHELDALMLQIERFYTSLDAEEFCIPSVCICPGQVCAALYKGLWHRAEILSSVIDHKTKVLFVDYGTVSEVYIENIKFLLTGFATLPKQAIRGSLSHIRPKNLHWCQESINCFLSMSCELMLYGQISEIYEEKRTVYMVLCDTNGSEVVQINRELVEKGFAHYDDEWQKTDKGRQRLHHLREDFPTFSMLELGEYPSYAELIDLKNKGIDYEWIIDHSVFHPGRLDLHENVPDVIRKLPFQLLTTNPFRRDIYLQLQHFM
ncbi:tudor domain-containing protein 5 [Eurosta solidaginis]|uniref:tudor domain-containing protein 5 n=1 Tax=Eurosta solidaginis TaxID=178769 RepID=UPI003530EFCB